MEKTVEELLPLAFRGRKPPEKSQILIGDMPGGLFKRAPLSFFTSENNAGYPIKNCFVWFPSGQSGHVKPRIKFIVSSPLENCNFYFFRTPNKRSKLFFILKGNNQTGVFFSANEMRFSAKMVIQSNHLTIGDDVYIGGAKLVLCNTIMTVGAGGLWSDGILIQGSDSHGIVDLGSMKIVNGGPKHITLERKVWLGRQSSVMKNVTIEEGAVVASGAVVSRNVPKACVVGGIPADVIKFGMSWTKSQSVISKDEKRDLQRLRDEIDGIVDLTKNTPRPPIFAPAKAKSRLADLARSVWVKATAAGVAGAVVFETVSELMPDL